tara:strand:- start:95 stop:856 length:762 start_codon:yes stop_codon:yes gene_type:complete
MKNLTLKNWSLFFSVSSCLLVSALAYSQETPPAAFTQANFVEGKRSMKNLVKFPRTKTDIEIQVICSAQATSKGRLKEPFCSSPDDPDQDFTMAVSRRLKSARLAPATVNERPEDVDFQFIVHFKKENELESIEVYPNNGKNVERLGLDYISAQRYSPYVWPSRCRDGGIQNDLIIQAAVVNKSGIATETNVISAVGNLPENCKAGLTSQLENARWIPATHNGQAVDSLWIFPIVVSASNFKRQSSGEQKSVN